MASGWLDWLELKPVVMLLIGWAIGFVTAPFAELFRNWVIHPRLELDFRHEFGEGTGYISLTLAREGSNEQDYYVRASVKNTSWTHTIARSCRAYLVTIEYEEQPGQYRVIHEDPIPLDWSFVGPQSSMDLPPNLNVFFDVFSVNSLTNVLTPRTTPRAVNWRNSLSRTGRYRYTVTVVCQGVDPVFLPIEFSWSGSFAKFKQAFPQQTNTKQR